MNPDEIDNYLEVEHDLDQQFNESGKNPFPIPLNFLYKIDKHLHYNKEKDINSYNKPYDISNFLTESENSGNIGKSTEITNEDNKTVNFYEYRTKIDVNSPKQFLIKRVQTNNKEGIHVNDKSYSYGKTLNNYTFPDVYNGDSFVKNEKIRDFPDKIGNLNGKTEIFVKEIEDIQDIKVNNEEECCEVRPCHYLKPCSISSNKQKLKKAFLTNSFLQISTKNMKMRYFSIF